MTAPQAQPTRRRFRRAPDEKRARILAEARACFNEMGYERATTAEIARRAQVSEGTVFHHFKTKRALLSVVSEEYGRELCDVVFSDQEVPKGLSGLLERAYAFIRENGAVGLGRPGTTHESAEIILVALRETIVDESVRLIEAWQAQGLARPMNARLVAEILFPVVHHLLAKFYTLGYKRVPAESLRELALGLEGALGGPIPRVS